MPVTLLRAAANVPATVALFLTGLVLAWTVDQPKWAAVKAIFAGPFMMLAASPFLLALHLIAGLAGISAARSGVPGRSIAILTAGLIGLVFVSGPVESATFGNPGIAKLAFVIAMTVPWLFSRPAFWPWRIDA